MVMIPYIAILKRHVNFRMCDWLPSMCVSRSNERKSESEKKWYSRFIRYLPSLRRWNSIIAYCMLFVCSRIYIYIAIYVAKREKVGKIAKDK